MKKSMKVIVFLCAASMLCWASMAFAQGNATVSQGYLADEMRTLDAPARVAGPIDMTAVMLRMVLALAFVIALAYGAGIAVKKWIVPMQAGSKKLINVIDVAYLGPKRAVYVIDAAGEIIVVGSDGSGLRLLTKLEGKKAEDLYRMIEQNKTVGFRGAMTKEVNAFVASGVSESRQGPDEREKLKNSIKDIHSQIEKLKRMKGEI